MLFVCYEHPAPSLAGSQRVLNSLKYLREKYGHEMDLVAFRLPRIAYPDLSAYCRVTTVELPYRPSFESARAVLMALKNISTSGRSFLNHSFSTVMAKKIDAMLENGAYDLIAADHADMLGYVLRKNIPVVLLETFAVAEITRMNYQMETHWLRKLGLFLYHLSTRNYARTYEALTASIAVSSDQKEMVARHSRRLNIEVIPFGVDTDYFQATGGEDPSPGLIISGSMDRRHNVAGVLWFYDKVYPLIRERVPGVRLFIVGGSPSREIRDLAADRSVTVTGYVDDLRPYLSRAWVAVAPLLEGLGVKVRVLQAMAMGKPVVATPVVTSGIDGSPGENIVIAERPDDFAGKVIELLNDRGLREKIGGAARRLMVDNHSWEKLADRLNDLLVRAAASKPPARAKRDRPWR